MFLVCIANIDLLVSIIKLGVYNPRFQGRYVTGCRMRFRPVRINVEISETTKATMLGLGMEFFFVFRLLEKIALCKFILTWCNANSNAHKHP